jgi:hypothetical protein
MSVFRVKLNNTQQGVLDLNPATTAVFATSIQRTVYVTGPKKRYRNLTDGETFTDCNYWKKFAYPQASYDQAFIEVVTDDGSIYSEIEEENNYPSVYTISVNDGTAFAANEADIIGDYGSPANFVQINSTDASGGDIRVKLNGLAGAIFDLKAGDTQVFNYGDLAVTKLNFDNDSGNDQSVQIIVSIKSTCQS